MHAMVVDKTPVVCEAAHRVLLPMNAKTTFASSLHKLPHLFEMSGIPDLMIVNLTNDLTGWEVVARVQGAGYRGGLVTVIDGPADQSALPLTHLSNARYITRPSSPAALEDLLRRAIRSIAIGQKKLISASPSTCHGIVGTSPQMREIFARIDKAASGEVNVCICGESGTGKELIARAIHYASPRRTRPLITLDCTTIPDGLMESHLFGHVKGAFTGATEHRDGVVSLAQTGTLFIDELAELSLHLQAKLLRVIQMREFSKVGGYEPIRTDMRLITATNQRLKSAVAQGTLREDLYYRVAVFMIEVPALRERIEDIPLLVDHFLRKFSAAYGRPVTKVAPSALERMIALPWPGNVRQLENVLEQAVVLAESDTLTERELFSGDFSSVSGASADPALSGLFEPGLPLREITRRHILRTLQKVRGNRTEAAALLQISVRSLQYKLKAYGMTRDLEEGSGARSRLGSIRAARRGDDRVG
jgi:DNA-binding NtrC family response regulator